MLPVWKKGSSTAEFFYEMYTLATEHPQRFVKTVVIYEEMLPDGNSQIRQVSNGCTTVELVGVIELGKTQLMQDNQFQS